ncbi:MAG: glutaredoxin 3 [Oleiphilaceae bacterium]|jgi:glutaredoxin 3
MSISTPHIIIYSSQYCPFCFRAKSIFQQKSVAFEEINVDSDSALRQEMTQKAGQRTVPQIWIGERHVGGCDDLMDLQYSGELDKILGLSE